MVRYVGDKKDKMPRKYWVGAMSVIIFALIFVMLLSEIVNSDILNWFSATGGIIVIFTFMYVVFEMDKGANKNKKG